MTVKKNGDIEMTYDNLLKTQANKLRANSKNTIICLCVICGFLLVLAFLLREYSFLSGLLLNVSAGVITGIIVTIIFTQIDEQEKAAKLSTQEINNHLSELKCEKYEMEIKSYYEPDDHDYSYDQLSRCPATMCRDDDDIMSLEIHNYWKYCSEIIPKFRAISVFFKDKDYTEIQRECDALCKEATSVIKESENYIYSPIGYCDDIPGDDAVEETASSSVSSYSFSDNNEQNDFLGSGYILVDIKDYESIDSKQINELFTKLKNKSRKMSKDIDALNAHIESYRL